MHSKNRLSLHSQMAGNYKTTESDRRHVFKSFKERVDSMKIEPFRKLNIRAHDYVETSHFLVSLEHWKEVNISGDFTEFLYEVEPLCQSLAQILHHQERIFTALHDHIQKNDPNSIQPLLELISQFVHDLGQDFMPFYMKFLRLIVELAKQTNPNESQNLKNTSNVLEWCFNSLAFAFKYLSRTLVTDLVPTFRELVPVLLLTKKTYISRFCAEALSFLIKKLKADTLKSVIEYAFEEQSFVLENQSYRDTLVVLFSESMKNSQQTFHSKSTIIFTVLLEHALNVSTKKNICICCLSDVIMNVIHHGTRDTCADFYRRLMQCLGSAIDDSNSLETLVNISHLLIALTFADSGSKVSDWDELFEITNRLMAASQDCIDTTDELTREFMISMVQLFSLIIRNSESQPLTKHFRTLCNYATIMGNSEYFLPFIDVSFEIAYSKMVQFGSLQTLQSFINRISDHLQLLRLTETLVKSENHKDFSEQVQIPHTLKMLAIESIDKQLKSDGPIPTLTVFSELKLLSFAQDFDQKQSLVLLETLTKLSASTAYKTPFGSDLLGLSFCVAVQLLDVVDPKSEVIEQVYGASLSLLPSCRRSSYYLQGVQRLLKFIPGHLDSAIKSDALLFCTSLAENLSIPDPQYRGETINLLNDLHTVAQMEFPAFLSQIRVIDQVPFVVANANDIKMRIRQMFDGLVATKLLSALQKLYVTHYIIGLLSNQFEPCWLATYDGLARISNLECSEELWKIIFQFFTFDYNSQSHSYHTSEQVEGSFNLNEVESFRSSDARLASSFELATSAVHTDANESTNVVFNDAKIKNTNLIYKSNLKLRVIKALKSMPSVAEAHGSELVNFACELFNYSLDAEFGVWTMREKLDLISVFATFKKLGKVPKNENLFELLTQELSSKQSSIQKEALDVIFAWKNQSINKYRDTLKNLLDDKLFREELHTLFSSNSESKVEDNDYDAVMPIILRILYGRAKGVSNNNSKNGRKYALATVLPNLPDKSIEQFLAIMSEKLRYEDESSICEDHNVRKQNLTNMSGYLHMLYEVYNGLGFKYAHILTTSIEPLVLTLSSCQHVLDTGPEDPLIEKIAKNVRQLGFKCLNQLFKITSKSYDWKREADTVYLKIVSPRLTKFAQENAQQPSSLMQIMLGWIDSRHQVPFFYFDDFLPVHAIMSLLSNEFTKETVISAVLDFCITALTTKGIEDESFFTLLAIVVESLLAVLPGILETSAEREINSKASTLLLQIIEGDYIQENDTRSRLVATCAAALEKPPSQIATHDKVSILISLVPIMSGFECAFEKLESLYEVCSKSFRMHKDRNMRESLVNVFKVFGDQFDDLRVVSEVLADLNSFSNNRLGEPDFERRLRGFRQVNEELYTTLLAKQWLPIIYCCLFFMNDYEELALRSNSAYTLMKFIDCLSELPSEEAARDHLSILNNIIKPSLKSGLKKESEAVRDGYVNVLGHLVQYGKFVPEMTSLKALLSDDENEDFFKNFTHIQLTARQKAVRKLIDVRNDLSPECIEDYIFPMTEIYIVCKDEKYRNILDDTHTTWSYLARCISWGSFRSIFRKRINAVSRSEISELRDKANIVVRLSQALHASFMAKRDKSSADCLKNVPDVEVFERQVIGEFFEPIMKIIKIRNDETVMQRTPLVEATVNCLLCVSEDIADARMSGTLTSTCQVLRSRTQHLRDAVRKILCKVSKILGPKYFKFIIKELKTALSRGSQIHVLSYTTHSLLVAVQDSFITGDLDESASLVADIIMEDTFGAAGQEKDADDYVSKMREVKSKKSYDTAEILSAKIGLSAFRYLVHPIKLLLSESVPLRTRKKLDELLRRYSAGLIHNSMSSSADLLRLCYELYQQSELQQKRVSKTNVVSEVEEHFLVNLNSKPQHMSRDNSQFSFTLQRFCFELMRSSLGKNPTLLTVSNLDGFVPLFENSLDAEDENLLLALFKILDLVVKLDFPPERDTVFMKSATRAFDIIQNSPSTTKDVCQIALRYLASIIRHKKSINLNDNVMSYLLMRLLPDLEEPDKQGLAFNFVKAVVSQHLVLPEVYEVMDKISAIMVVNHNKEIRDMSRGVYYQFLMEFEQGTTRLEKTFKFLVNNLSYPAQTGRQSVMELMHSIILKAPLSLLTQLAGSFFVGLANVAVSDDVPKCREMATFLIGQIIKKLDQKELGKIEKFAISWMQQKSNLLLNRCGLTVYKIYVSVLNFGANHDLDNCALRSITEVLSNSRNDLTESENSWEDVYISMNVFSTLYSSMKEKLFTRHFQDIWYLLLDTLLYPHTWVRLLSAKLVGVLLDNLDILEFEITPSQLQTITYRLLRQLSAPVVSRDLGEHVVRNMVKIIKKWETENTPFYRERTNEEEDDDPVVGQKFTKATDFVISRICAILRQELKADASSVAKKSAIQMGALISQIVTTTRLTSIAEQLIMSMYNIIEGGTESTDSDEVLLLSRECLKVLEDRLGVTEYTSVFTSVKLQVDERRKERRVKRAQLAINAPDIAARRKMKKHERFRENRKHERDENGYYRPKRLKRSR